MESDDQMRKLLHEAEARVRPDPRALASIYAAVDVERRKRSRRRRSRGLTWLDSLRPMVPAFAGTAAALIILVGVVRLLPLGTSPSASPATPGAPSASLATPFAPSETGLGPMEPSALLANGMLVPRLGVTAFNCERWFPESGDPENLSPSGYAIAIGRGSCVVPKPGDPLAHYAVYATREALAAEYAAIMNSKGIPAGGACTAAFPANATWNLPGLPAFGSLGCFARNDGVQFVWTDYRRRMLGQWYTYDYNEGRAFWEAWSTGLDGFEELLEGNTSSDHADPCVRAPEPDFGEALAVLACPLPGSENRAFYVQYYVPWLVLDGPDPPGDPFPDDPMTMQFLSIMAEGGIDADTPEGCYELTTGRYMWGYLNPGFSKDTGAVSDPGKAMGYVGCYTRTEGANTTTRLVFTSNVSAVLILWDAPDIERAIAFLQGWIRQGQIQ